MAKKIVPKNNSRTEPAAKPGYKPSTCPYCGDVAYSSDEEMDHMDTSHPDIVAARLAEAEREMRYSSSWDD